MLVVQSGMTPFIPVIKSLLMNPKLHLISPMFKRVYLKFSEKTLQFTLLFLVFGDITLHYATDVVLNSTVLS